MLARVELWAVFVGKSGVAANHRRLFPGRARVRGARLVLGSRRPPLRRVRAIRRAAPAARQGGVAVRVRRGGLQGRLRNYESERLRDGVEQEVALPYQRPRGGGG